MSTFDRNWRELQLETLVDLSLTIGGVWAEEDCQDADISLAEAPLAGPYPVGPGFSAGQSPYPSYAAAPPSGYAPFAPQVPPEQELDFLKNQAQAMREQLEQIEARMREMETGK